MKTKHIKLKVINFLLLPVSVLAVLTACMGTTETATDSTPEVPAFLTEEVSASGEIVPTRWITLSYPNGAAKLDVKVTEGDQVDRGDVLVTSNDERLLTAFYQAQSALERAQFAYNQTVFPPSQAAIAAARAALANAEANLERQEDLNASDIVIDAAEADIAAAQASLDELLEGASFEEKNAAEYDLRVSELALETANDAFDLTAPYAGTIVEIFVNSDESIGAGQPVVTLADLSELRVITTDLSEVDVTRLRAGQSAEIVFDALSDQTFTGTIDSIAHKSSGTSSVYYEVTLSLEDIPEELRWGMTAFITFPLE